MVDTTDDTLVWALVAVVGAGTLAFRLSFLLLFDRLDTVPPRVERALSFVPPAVFAAIALPAVLPLESLLSLSPNLGRLLAAAAAAVVARRTENLVATIAVGMGVLVVVQAL
ncbi:MAG: AzlD domain-containing protein [Haloarculaceae archaeon]